MQVSYATEFLFSMPFNKLTVIISF